MASRCLIRSSCCWALAVDWGALIALWALYYVEKTQLEPFRSFIGEATLLNGSLTLPLKPDTVPSWALPILGFAAPVVVFLVVLAFMRDCRHFYRAAFGLLMTVTVTAVVTEALKLVTGEPRPDFFWRCFPDGKPVFENGTGQVVCSGKTSDIREGYESFPSGHSSFSFAGMWYLGLYVVRVCNGAASKSALLLLILLFLPLSAATVVAITRLRDDKHHLQDVVGGAIIGMFIASIFYYQSMIDASNRSCTQGGTRNISTQPMNPGYDLQPITAPTESHILCIQDSGA